MTTEFTIINKSIKFPIEIHDIVVEGDTNSKTITFLVQNRFFDGVDLSSKLIRVAYKNAEGKTGYDTAYLNTLNVDSFTFDWTLSSNVSVKAGEVSIWVEFSEENYVWKTKPQSFNVEPSFHVFNNATPLDYTLAKEFFGNYTEEIVTDINDTDEPILIEGRRILVPVLEDIIVSGDNRSQVISFTMDRYYENVDRSTKTIAIKFLNAEGSTDRTSVVNKIITDTTITFGWLIDSKVSKKDGYVSFAVEVLGYDENNNFQVWSTIPAQIKVEQGLYVDDTIEEPNPSWYQSFQIEADKKLNELTSNEEFRVIQENIRIENENLRIQQDATRPIWRNVTQVEYDALPQSEKENPLYVYNIIDAKDIDLANELKALIDDTNAAKIAAENVVLEKNGINDDVVSNLETWSSKKIEDQINKNMTESSISYLGDFYDNAELLHYIIMNKIPSGVYTLGYYGNRILLCLLNDTNIYATFYASDCITFAHVYNGNIINLRQYFHDQVLVANDIRSWVLKVSQILNIDPPEDF